MRFWWRRRRDEDEDPIVEELNQEAHAAQDAKDSAKRALQNAVSKGPEVYRVSESLRWLRQRNRFSEMMLDSFRGNGNDA